VTYDPDCKKEISVQIAKAIASLWHLTSYGRVNLSAYRSNYQCWWQAF